MLSLGGVPCGDVTCGCRHLKARQSGHWRWHPHGLAPECGVVGSWGRALGDTAFRRLAGTHRTSHALPFRWSNGPHEPAPRGGVGTWVPPAQDAQPHVLPVCPLAGSAVFPQGHLQTQGPAPGHTDVLTDRVSQSISKSGGEAPLGTHRGSCLCRLPDLHAAAPSSSVPARGVGRRWQIRSD